MDQARRRRTAVIVAGCLAIFVVVTLAQKVVPEKSMEEQVPVFRVDPAWPKPLPNHWIVGAVVGVAVDGRDHVWITHRPSTLQPNETRSIWKAAPPVLEFDRDGTLLSSWGGPGPGYEWPQLEHGIYIDSQDHVWLGAGGDRDAQVLKFTRDGKFLLQIGHQGQGRGSNDTENLGAAANMVVDAAANELYVADGYVNHRVIVFDATTGCISATGARTASGLTTITLRRRVKNCRYPSAAPCSMKINRANMIRPVLPRPNFESFTPFRSRMTASCTFATAPMIAFRSFERTAHL